MLILISLFQTNSGSAFTYLAFIGGKARHPGVGLSIQECPLPSKSLREVEEECFYQFSSTVDSVCLLFTGHMIHKKGEKLFFKTDKQRPVDVKCACKVDQFLDKFHWL